MKKSKRYYDLQKLEAMKTRLENLESREVQNSVSITLIHCLGREITTLENKLY